MNFSGILHLFSTDLGFQVGKLIFPADAQIRRVLLPHGGTHQLIIELEGIVKRELWKNEKKRIIFVISSATRAVNRKWQKNMF